MPEASLPASAGRSQWLDRRALAFLVLALVVAGVVLPFAPGLVSFDTNVSLFDSGTGVYRDWYTPFGSLVWALFEDSGAGLGTAFLWQTLLVVGGLYALLRLGLRRVPSALVSGAICAFPPMYAQLSNLSRDTLFLAFTLLAFAAIGWSLRTSGRVRTAAYAAAVICAIAAFLYRQNGASVLFVVVLVIAWQVLADRPRIGGGTWRTKARLALYALGIAAAVTVLVALATVEVYASTDHVLKTHPERHVFIYDLAALTMASGKSEFPPELSHRPRGVTPPDMTARTIKDRFDYASILTLYPGGDWETDFANQALAAKEAASLRKRWLNVVTARPWGYFLERLRLTASQLGLMHRPTDAFYGLVVGDNFGHPIEFSHGYEAAADYVITFVGRDATVPLDLPWLYVLIAAISALALSRQRTQLRVLVYALVGAVALNLAALGVTSVASSFRYTTINVAIALVLIALAVSVQARPRRS